LAAAKEKHLQATHKQHAGCAQATFRSRSDPKKDRVFRPGWTGNANRHREEKRPRLSVEPDIDRCARRPLRRRAHCGKPCGRHARLNPAAAYRRGRHFSKSAASPAGEWPAKPPEGSPQAAVRLAVGSQQARSQTHSQTRVRPDVHRFSASGAGRIRDNFRQTLPCGGAMTSLRERSMSIPRFTVNKI
jgi:hypothetical protein